jgi:ribose transport system permease protein
MTDTNVGGVAATAVIPEDPATGASVPRRRDEAAASRAGRLRHALTGALAPKIYLLGVLAAVLVVGTILSPFFLTERNLLAILVTASVIAVLAIGQFMVVVTRGIDLSVGSVVALSSVVAALILRAGQPVLAAVLAALAVAALIGLINGVLVVYGRVAPFIVTLAMLSVARGLAYLIQHDRLIPISNSTFLSIFSGNVGPVPSPVLVALLVMLGTGTMMAFMPRGRRLYAIGCNPEAARLSGLPIKRDALLAYMTSSALAGLAGLMLAAQLTQGSAITGQGYELDSIAAAVVGGTSLFGGTGDPVSAVLGGLIIGAILNLMDIMGVPNEAQLIVQGVVIVFAVLLTSNGIKGVTGFFRRLRRREPGS